MSATDNTYLDFPGLAYYDSKIKTYISKKSVKSISEQQIIDLFKKDGNIVLSKDNVAVNKNKTETISFSEATGNVTVASSDEDVVTATVSGNTIIVTGVSVGSAIITVNVAATTEYKTTSKTISVIVELGIITITTVPSQNGTLTYNGTSQIPVWNDYNSEQLILGGITTGVNADIYTATFTPREGYQWSDETISAKNVTWDINRATITTPVPTQNNTLTYDGNIKSPLWDNYDNTKLSIDGTVSAVNAGTYTAKFTPTSNYKWNDDTITAKNSTWTIERADGNAILSKTSVTLSNDTPSDTITVSGATGEITVSSADPSIAAASINGNIITITKA